MAASAQPRFAVVVHQRPRLRPVYVEPLAHRVLAIVVALDQRLSGLVVAALDLRRIEFHVIAAPRGGMHAPAAHARDELIVGNIDLEHVIDRHGRGLHGLGLRDGARKAVEQVAALAVVLLQPLLHQPDDDLVGHQLPGVHHLFCRQPEGRPRLDRGAQHVASRDLRDAELVADEGGLRALAGARRAQEDQPHASILRTASRSRGVSTPGGISRGLTTTAMR